jgi:hypothetical protein
MDKQRHLMNRDLANLLLRFEGLEKRYEAVITEAGAALRRERCIVKRIVDIEHATNIAADEYVSVDLAPLVAVVDKGTKDAEEC